MEIDFQTTSSLNRSLSAADLCHSFRNVPDENQLIPSFSPSRSPSKRRSIANPEASLSFSRKCTYLTEDIRKRYELGYEAAAPNAQQNNFVKKLVATLERRHKDLRELKSARSLEKEPSQLKSSNYKSTGKQVTEPEWIVSRLPDKLDSFQESTERESTGSRGERVPAVLAKRMSASVVKVTAQRALKRFTSILGMKKLPAKGSRDYYSDRESLSDELGAFRRKTLPKLMQKSLLNVDPKDWKLRELAEQRQFSQLINGCPLKVCDGVERATGNHATIRRVCSIRIGKPLDDELSGSQYRAPNCHFRQENNANPAAEKGVFRTSTIKEATRIVGRRSFSIKAPLPPLITCQKRISTIHETAQLASQDSEFESVLLRHHRPDSVIYDVPRSQPIPVSSSFSSKQQSNIPHYENAEIFINKDKRLNLTEFSTF